MGSVSYHTPVPSCKEVKTVYSESSGQGWANPFGSVARKNVSAKRLFVRIPARLDGKGDFVRTRLLAILFPC